MSQPVSEHEEGLPQCLHMSIRIKADSTATGCWSRCRLPSRLALQCRAAVSSTPRHDRSRCCDHCHCQGLLPLPAFPLPDTRPEPRDERPQTIAQKSETGDRRPDQTAAPGPPSGSVRRRRRRRRRDTKKPRAVFGGNHLSNTTCLTQVFFKHLAILDK